MAASEEGLLLHVVPLRWTEDAPRMGKTGKQYKSEMGISWKTVYWKMRTGFEGDKWITGTGC